LHTLLIDLPSRHWTQRGTLHDSTADDEDAQSTITTTISPPPLSTPSTDAHFPLRGPFPSTLASVEIAGFSTGNHTDVLTYFHLDAVFFPGLQRLKVHFAQHFCAVCKERG